MLPILSNSKHQLIRYRVGVKFENIVNIETA